MFSRRDFLRSTVGVAVPFVAGGAVALSRLIPESVAPIYTMVYDIRSAESIRFAKEAQRQGLKTSEIFGDVTDLWYNDLYYRWLEGPIAIGGVTPWNSLFCLETLGNDIGLRCLLQVDHWFQPDGSRIDHLNRGPGNLDLSPGTKSTDSGWGLKLVESAIKCSEKSGGLTRRNEFASIAREHLSAEPTLVTWVLTPKSGRR